MGWRDFCKGGNIKRILLVSYYLPGRGHGGGLRLLDLYRLMRQAFPGVRVDLAACRHSVDDEPEAVLHEVFDNIYLFDPRSFDPDTFRSEGLLAGQYDVVDLQYLQAGRFIRSFRNSGTHFVIFSPMESMVRATGIVLRNLLGSMSLPDLVRAWQHLGYAGREIFYTFLADRVLCVSEGDASVLRSFRPWSGIFAIETGVSSLEFPRSLGSTMLDRRLDDSKRVVFVAFFGSATNRDALAWYLREVHPVVAEAVPGYSFEIVGRGLDNCSLVGDHNVSLVGEVDFIETQLEGAWVGIAPALSGAGLRGKINQYAIAGVPCVASSLAAAGLAYSDGESICLAKNAAEFAENCIELLSSSRFNWAVGQSARSVCLANYVWDAKIDQVARVYDLSE